MSESSITTELASKVTVVSGGAGFAAWIASWDWIAIISISVALVGLFISICNFFVNLNFQRQKNKREQEIHELTKKKLEGQCNVKD